MPSCFWLPQVPPKSPLGAVGAVTPARPSVTELGRTGDKAEIAALRQLLACQTEWFGEEKAMHPGKLVLGSRR